MLVFHGNPDKCLHQKLTFVVIKTPPCYVFEQVAFTAAEESGDYE